MLYYEIPWFYQYFTSENQCFLNLYSDHAVRILELSLEVEVFLQIFFKICVLKNLTILPETTCVEKDRSGSRMKRRKQLLPSKSKRLY